MEMVTEALENLIMVDIERTEAMRKLPKKQQDELHAEWMYSNPNDYREIQDLYAGFGIEYRYESWLIAQAIFVLAGKKDQERLQGDT